MVNSRKPLNDYVLGDKHDEPDLIECETLSKEQLVVIMKQICNPTTHEWHASVFNMRTKPARAYQTCSICGITEDEFFEYRTPCCNPVTVKDETNA